MNKKILFVNTCVREESRTALLARRLLERLDGEVTQVRPDAEGLMPLNRETLKRREALTAAGETDGPELAAARDFAKADIVIIAAPYWDLAFPALLKIYLENVTVCGLTFRYTEDGTPRGLCRAESLYYVTTSGGPIIHNFGFEYVDALAREFYGIRDTRFISAQGLDIWGADTEAIMAEAMREIDRQTEE